MDSVLYTLFLLGVSYVLLERLITLTTYKVMNDYMKTFNNRLDELTDENNKILNRLNHLEYISKDIECEFTEEMSE